MQALRGVLLSASAGFASRAAVTGAAAAGGVVFRSGKQESHAAQRATAAYRSFGSTLWKQESRTSAAAAAAASQPPALPPSGSAQAAADKAEAKAAAALAAFCAALVVGGAWAAQQAWLAPWEEAPITGRLRPTMPVDSEPQTLAHIRLCAWFERQMPFIGQGATLYPVDHPLTKRAEALRDEFLAAAQAEIEQRQGADSPAAERFRQRLARGPPPVRVFSCSAAHVAGACVDSGILVSDSTDSMADTMAHEVAHFVLQHSVEPVVMNIRRGLVESTALISALAASPMLWCRHLRLPALAGAAVAIWCFADSPLWRKDTSTALQGSERLPLLLPGAPGFELPTPEALASRALYAALEAEHCSSLPGLGAIPAST